MSLLIPALLSQSTPAPGGFVPYGWDFTTGTDPYLGVTSPGVSDTSAFTLVMCFELPAADMPAYVLTLFAGAGNFFRIQTVGLDTDARALYFEFYDAFASDAWLGTTVATISKGAKHVVAFSYSGGTRYQVYIDGVLSSITGENQGNISVAFAREWTIGMSHVRDLFETPAVFSSFWWKDTSDDLSVTLGNYVSGTTPLDAANGAVVYNNWVSGALGIWTLSGAPSNVVY